MTRAERRRQERETGSRAVYQYTLAQIEAIKRQAVADKKKELKAEITEEINEHIQKEWKKREELLEGGTESEIMEKVMCLLLATSVNVLVQKFRWKPVDEGSDKRSSLIRFSDAVLGEVNRILADEQEDIRTYADKVYETCGIRYEIQSDVNCA